MYCFTLPCPAILLLCSVFLLMLMLVGFRLLDIKSSRLLPLHRISRPVHLLVECVDNCEYSNRIGVVDLLMS